MGMREVGLRPRLRRATVAAGLGLVLALSACGQNSAGTGEEAAGSGEAGAGGTKVGVILPETDTSARWEGFDKPMLDRALRAEGLDPDIQNAQGDEQKFSTLADGMISAGVRVLVIASISGDGIDKPMLDRVLRAEGLDPAIQNAQGDEQ